MTLQHPERILQQLTTEKVTTLTAAPAFMQTFTDYGLANRLSVEGLHRVGIGGAPVSPTLCAAIQRVFPNAAAEIIYGSTEAEPVASIAIEDVLALGVQASTWQHGVPGGYVHADTQVKIIRPYTNSIRILPGHTLAEWTVDDGAYGELIVSGPHVNRCYFDNPDADREHKICDEQGRIWHRMGDVATRDRQGRIWIAGRVSRLIRQNNRWIYPLLVESQLDALPGIRKSALHACGDRVFLWIEGDSITQTTHNAIHRVLEKMHVYVHQVRIGVNIPLDARHRSKVDYHALDRRAIRWPFRTFI